MKILRLIFITSLLIVSLSFIKSTPSEVERNSDSALSQTPQEIFDEKVKPLLSRNTKTLSLSGIQSSLIPQASAELFDNNAQALILVDLDTGEVLYERNGSERLPIASLTKIMTAVIALDLAAPDSLFTVTDYAASQIPTKIGVVPDEKMKLTELLDALLLTSANDAASVIQQGVETKFESMIFITAMNEKAKVLGLKNTSFTNPQGFDDPANYSSLEDLAILSHYALTNYKEIENTAKKAYQFLPPDENHKQFDLYNWNGLIDVYPDTIGMKIGSTGRAGKTTIVVSQRGGKRLLAGVLGAPDIIARDLWASQLLDYGYEQTLSLEPIGITEPVLQEKYNTWNYF